MNILFLELNLNPSLGGVERVTHIIGNALEKQGYNVFYAYRHIDESNLPEAKKLKYSFDLSEEMLHKLFYDFVQTHKIDVIISQNMWHKHLRSFVRRYRKKLGFKILYCLHLSPTAYKIGKTKSGTSQIKNLISQLLFGTDVIAHGMKRIYELVDGFVVLSESFKFEIMQNCRFSSDEKLYAISNPLSFRRGSDIISKEDIVLVVSRFSEEQKNLKSALRIWKRIEAVGYGSWQLKLVGYGPDEEALRKYSEELGLQRVVFEGKSNNVKSYYEKSRLFMMTSRNEGFGMTLIEAQQMGCVPLAYDTYTALHDIISNGENGMIIPFEDEERYAQQMMRLMDDEALRSKLMRRGMETSAAFNVEHITDCWISLLNKVNETSL